MVRVFLIFFSLKVFLKILKGLSTDETFTKLKVFLKIKY